MATGVLEIPGNQEKLVEEVPVYIRSGGKNLFGIVHRPINECKKVAIIFLNAGLQYRVGPHRIYVTAARRLSRLGFTVLRLDFPGVGDSEGEIADIHFDLFDRGHTMAAIDSLFRIEKIEKVVLLGLCAGARNAIKAAAIDPRVDAIIAWSLPIITDSQKFSNSNFSSDEVMSRGAAKTYMRRWLKKSLSVSAWRRYLFSSNNSPSPKTVLCKLFTGWNTSQNKPYTEFFEALDAYVQSGRKALFAYGERDTIMWEEFELTFKQLSTGTEHDCDYFRVAGGSHTYTSREAKKAVIEKTVQWFAQNYPTGSQ